MCKGQGRIEGWGSMKNVLCYQCNGESAMTSEQLKQNEEEEHKAFEEVKAAAFERVDSIYTEPEIVRRRGRPRKLASA